MSEILKIVGMGFITAVSALILKPSKPELSFAVTVTGVIIIMMFLMEMLQETMSVFVTISEMTGVENGLLKVLLKIIGVGYLTEFGAGILTDFGNVTIANKIVLAGKITIVMLSMPVIESLLNLVKGFLQLI